MNRADSAGVPWEGRSFEHNDWGDDDGSAPEQLVEAIRRFRAREVGEADVVDAVREARLLVPLVAHLGEAGENEHGQLVDKSQELSIVTVRGPDGRSVLPAFTSTEAMSRWNPRARPVPTDAVRVALAAASERTDIVILDPTSATEFVIRRPAVWAIARSERWTPCYRDPVVVEAVASAVSGEAAVRGVELQPGDPDARMAGPELTVVLALEPGLDAARVRSIVATTSAVFTSDERLVERVDSVAISLVTASSEA